MHFAAKRRLAACRLGWFSLLVAVGAACLQCRSACRAEESSPAADSTTETDEPEVNWKFASKTGGGKQFWTDVFVHRAWRIQRHAFTGHHRLLDEENVRRTWGGYPHCRREFESLRRELALPPMPREVVVTLHGLGRTRESMEGMGSYLAEQGEYGWVNLSYASTRDTIDAHAEALDQVLRNLDGVETVHVVAHSMGNLVTRRYLAMIADSSEDDEGRPRLGRFVMLAPPNSGSAFAERLRDNPIFKIAFGASGGQLAKQWDELQSRLATPACEFGIIAGDYDKPIGSNPLLEGSDDLVVSVEETKLPGARDFLVVAAPHTFIMDDPVVQQSTLRFLQHGYFVAADRRRPIAAEAPAP